MSDEPPVLAPGPLPIGGDVHIISALGRVGDGLVYAARDGLKPARLREYAPPGLASRRPDGLLGPAESRFADAWADGVARFLEQGDRLARIVHPGIAPIWRSVGNDAPAGFLIGAPTGEPLAAALAAGRDLPPSDVVRLAQEIAAALAEIHARGLTHLDISPDTVAITGGRMQLTDFAVDRRAFLPLLETQDGLVRPGYSPIELYDGSQAEPLGPPADIYAACALIFRLITGRDPAPWQQRWRDPSTPWLADHGAYPPAFIEAVRTGLSIEPDERYRDGTDWLAAISSAPLPRPVVAVEPAPPVAAVAVPPVQPAPAVARRGGSGWLIPALVIGLVVLALAVGALFAIQQGWFGAQPDDPVADRTQSNTQRSTPLRRAATPSLPTIAPGRTVAGQLARGDQRRGSGEYQDRYMLAGRAGDEVELRLSSGDFDPMLIVTGPGFNATNDDDAETGSRDSRLVITLPRDGEYTVAVTSYDAGETGDYVLEASAVADQPEIAVVTPALLDGRWRLASDMSCAQPLAIRTSGADVTVEHRGRAAQGRALDGVGRTVRVRLDGGPPDGADVAFVLAQDGESFRHDDEAWIRC